MQTPCLATRRLALFAALAAAAWPLGAAAQTFPDRPIRLGIRHAHRLGVERGLAQAFLEDSARVQRVIGTTIVVSSKRHERCQVR